MGKFRCECDEYTFSDTVLPNNEYYSMFPSEIVWETPEKIGEDGDFQKYEIEIWECPKCRGLTRFDGTAYRTCYYKRVDDPNNNPKPSGNAWEEMVYRMSKDLDNLITMLEEELEWFRKQNNPNDNLHHKYRRMFLTLANEIKKVEYNPSELPAGEKGRL